MSVRSHARRRPPRLEALEGRVTPATFTVTATAASGPGTLRQAILDANANPGPYTIAFNVGGGGGQTLSTTQAVDIPYNSTVSFDVKATNGGDNDESNVKVKLTITGFGICVTVTVAVAVTLPAALVAVNV